MAQIIREITSDVVQPNNLRAITAKQNDLNSRFLKINITNAGTPLKVDRDAQVIMNVKRTDGEARPFYGSVNDDGSVTVPLTTWMLELVGSINCDVSIISSEDSQKLTTMQFSIYVEEAVLPQSYLEENENYDVFVELLSAAEKAEACAEATEEAIKATDKANAAANGVIITERNNDAPLTFWVGTQAEYDAIVNKDLGCFYIISDDSDLEEIHGMIGDLSEIITNYHTPYDISAAVVPSHSKDKYVLTKCGKTLELCYTLVNWQTTTDKSYISGQLAKIEGYAPRGTFYIPAIPHVLLGDLWNNKTWDMLFVRVAPDADKKNTLISLTKEFGMMAQPVNQSLISFNLSFICQ